MWLYKPNPCLAHVLFHVICLSTTNPCNIFADQHVTCLHDPNMTAMFPVQGACVPFALMKWQYEVQLLESAKERNEVRGLLYKEGELLYKFKITFLETQSPHCKQS